MSGTELENLQADRLEAVRAAGEMIDDASQSFWEHPTPWNMHVTDDQHHLLFTLQFSAKVPSGDARYIPEGTGDAERSNTEDRPIS